MAAPIFTPTSSGLIGSRWVSTVPLTLSIPIMSTTTATGAIATTEMSATTKSAEVLEDDILKHIRETSTFNRIRAMVSVVGSYVPVHTVQLIL